MGEPFPAPLRVAMRSPLPFLPCVPDRPSKILLVQVGTLSFSHPLFGVSVLFIILYCTLFIYLYTIRAEKEFKHENSLSQHTGSTQVRTGAC